MPSCFRSAAAASSFFASARFLCLSSNSPRRCHAAAFSGRSWSASSSSLRASSKSVALIDSATRAWERSTFSLSLRAASSCEARSARRLSSSAIPSRTCWTRFRISVTRSSGMWPTSVPRRFSASARDAFAWSLFSCVISSSAASSFPRASERSLP